MKTIDIHVKPVFGLLCLIIGSMVVRCSSQSLSQNVQLMTDLLDGYDRRFRPVLDQAQPIHVNITFDLIALQDFDEVKEKFAVMGVFHLSWMDEKLVWNPASYGNVTSQVYRICDVWYPILVLTNPSKDFKDVAQDWMTTRVYSNGLVLFYPGSMFEATCSIDVTYYPFDIQTCYLQFVPWGVGIDEMILQSRSNTVLQSYFSQNGEWTFIELTAEDALNSGWNMVTFTFKLQRKPTFLLVNVILPIIFMAAISVFVFLLPPESGERVSFSITVVLALAVFFTLISDNLPKTSSPLSHLSYFLTIILIYSVVMCIIAVCNLHIYFKDEKKAVPKFIASTVNFIRCKMCKGDKRVGTHKKTRRNQITVVEPALVAKPALDQPEEFSAMSEVSTTSLTWKDVSNTVDVTCMIFFSVAIIFTCTVYLYILGSNTSK